MLNELDGAPLGPAEQLLEPPLALDQRQVAQITAVMLDQVEGEQHHLMSPALAPQRVVVRRAVVADNHRLAVDQKRLRPDEALCRFDDGREAVGPVMAALREAADARAVPAHHQPITIVLNFVNPQWAGRRPRHL